MGFLLLHWKKLLGGLVLILATVVFFILILGNQKDQANKVMVDAVDYWAKQNIKVTQNKINKIKASREPNKHQINELDRKISDIKDHVKKTHKKYNLSDKEIADRYSNLDI